MSEWVCYSALNIGGSQKCYDLYIGNFYEWRVEASGSMGVEYYYVGSQRVAMRVGTALSYLFGDHLVP